MECIFLQVRSLNYKIVINKIFSKKKNNKIFLPSAGKTEMFSFVEHARYI